MSSPEYRTAPLKTDKMPPGVFYIVGNEAAERFSYYGMNSILVIFMTHYMMTASGAPDLLKPARAEEWYHNFVSVTYGLCVLGAFLADAVLGKYRTILFLSIAYCCGHFALAMNDTRIGLFIGFTLIALGAGGIKPCVSANVGDQFGESNQHLLPRVFSWFYFSINAGSVISTLLVPWLLDPYKTSPELAARLPAWLVSFLDKCHGPAIAFGTPGIFMVIATIVFWFGRRKFVHIPPVGIKKYLGEFFDYSKFKSSRGDIKEHGVQKIVVPFKRAFAALQLENLKTLGNLLTIVPFVAMFWALWQQNFSSWVVQAEKMDRHLFGVNWLPAQIQTVNPIFILLLLPLFSYAIYPAINRFYRLTPLRKIGTGLFTGVGAFLIVAWIQARIDAGQTPNIIWQVLAFVVLTSAEVMVSVTHLEFAYTQAPKKMKSLVMCTYLGAISLGNLFTGRVNSFIQNPDGSVKLAGAGYFFFFAEVMFVTAILFVVVAGFYRGKTYIQDEAEAQPA
jgi:POT family proton-dependent oligopeptide transporter